MYETGTAVEVRALHCMPGMPPPEGELHAHDYRLEVVAHRGELDEQGMVVDLDVLNAALEQIADTVRDRNLDDVVGTARVTVEVFARWAHGELASRLEQSTDLSLRVRVFESADQFGGYAGPVHRVGG
jgi:6-pyruvoyltetrahydropterin/6-carboxytetrahydropterin synthase